MEGIVVEREGLVEGGDFVDNGEGKHQNDDYEIITDIRENDFLGEPLLGEGQALRELLGRPVVHGALQSPGGR